jgi:hypothetical protein
MEIELMVFGSILDWQHLAADRNIAASAAIMRGDPTLAALSSMVSGERSLLPYPTRRGVRVGEVWGHRAEIGGAQVVVADQLELALVGHVGLVGTRAAIIGLRTDGLVRSHALNMALA